MPVAYKPGDTIIVGAGKVKTKSRNDHNTRRYIRNPDTYKWDKPNPEYRDYDPNMVEDIFATVVSFLTPTDIATMALGGGVGGAAIKKIAVKKWHKPMQTKHW